ncbi:MAG: 50S ribosomal protein L29 [Candidatus Margulisbacteria bacterium]|nr:50S ribosomal protein L29 [Candidatus Margulisiibacteriota bacterium]MBU1022099.1 50S ribosomal protein L29 [Candidatus Margulisiibacteriota bacterium]MBU1729694.1 50S ribosomal protein L29 [Candidatus Margulisiibacteriota bacterium]MBU1955014.1 50S ribosomal protein L29 [Candidatus Margulisiibacteriota bacterium]
MKSKKTANEIKELNLDELKFKEIELRKEQLNLRIEKASQQLKNPLRLRAVRRDIARVLTAINEKERAQSGTRA